MPIGGEQAYLVVISFKQFFKFSLSRNAQVLIKGALAYVVMIFDVRVINMHVSHSYLLAVFCELLYLYYFPVVILFVVCH